LAGLGGLAGALVSGSRERSPQHPSNPRGRGGKTVLQGLEATSQIAGYSRRDATYSAQDTGYRKKGMRRQGYRDTRTQRIPQDVAG